MSKQYDIHTDSGIQFSAFFFFSFSGIGRSEAACASSEFACASNGHCIPDDYVCDDIMDCDDESDEEPVIEDCQAYLDGLDEEESIFPSFSTDDEDDDDDDGDDDDEDDEPLYIQFTKLNIVLSSTEVIVEQEPPQQCGLRKCQVGSKFKLMDGLTHYYTYHTKSVTEVSGSSPSNTSLAIRAQLAFTVLTACELELELWSLSTRAHTTQVRDMVVETTRSDSGGQLHAVDDNAFIAAVTKNPLRFAYHDGLVEEICPRPDEEPNALNFKRAAVSLLQNTMPRLDLDHHTTELKIFVTMAGSTWSIREKLSEFVCLLKTDVVGHCEVDYEVAGVAGKGLLLKKTRNIPSCTTRSSTTSFIKGVEYDFVGVS
ncbi:Vitellogenin [Portunus trituberculatus]|uniref:Vitellogenin n=1 Tax=Portunus trituberculatus TaxID=210409 RepID=A0A5B7GMS9_PORTR|nr:Vitellogenin [Portunus trituberculatus]